MSPNRLSKKSGRVRESPAAMVYRLSLLAITTQLTQMNTTRDNSVHPTTVPLVNASAGSARNVQPLVVDDPTLMAEVKIPRRRPART